MVLGLVLLLVAGVIAAVLFTVGNGRSDSADARLALEQIIDDVDLEQQPGDVEIGELRRCPIGRTTSIVDDLIDRLDDSLLAPVDRGASGIIHDEYVIGYPASDSRLVVCERVGDDPSINTVGVGLAPRPDDIMAYLEDISGTTNIQLEGDEDFDPDDPGGTVVRWICVESDDVTARFCEALWDDGEVLLSFYVGGASSGRVDVEEMMEIIAEVADDWIAELADLAESDD